MNERDLFMGALRIEDAAERCAYLDRCCGGDTTLRQRVKALLGALEQAGSFLQMPAGGRRVTSDVLPPEPSSASDAAEGPGTLLGPYKLLERVGEGGFGVVFLAEQTRPIRRKVALKVIKPGMDSKQVIARFEAERQALALMDHPNIAKILDGGSTPSGRPYFVMELVRGVPITAFCDENQLTPRRRLDLFVSVCQAVEHAHQKGIIHRDLKPSNILVTMHDTVPVVKVIDFGVAKALGQELTDKTLFTGLAQMVGTPLYMSPEQAGQSGLDVDTRSDIYALGVLLYELLTGTTPFPKERFQKTSYEEIRRIIREEDPPRPSTRLLEVNETLPSISAQRRTQPAQLRSLVKGELDWIVMKALEKDRSRRYDTSTGFALDVQRYLADEPVLACPPTRLYRFRKLVRRNKVPLLVATLAGGMLLVTVVLLGVSNLLITRERDLKDAALKQEQSTLRAKEEALEEAKAQRNRSQLNFNKACGAINSMLTDLAITQMTRDAKMESLRREALRKALELYQAFLRPGATDLSAREETAFASQQLMTIYDQLSQSEAAEKAGRQAQQCYEQLTADYPDRPGYWPGLAQTHQLRGERLINKLGKGQEAEEHFRVAVDVWKRLRDEFPTDPNYQSALAQSRSTFAYLLWSTYGRFDEAEQLLRQAVDGWRKLAADYPAVVPYQSALARDYTTLGVLLRSINRRPEAEQALRAAWKTLDELAVRPNGGDNRGALARVLGHLGGLLAQTGRPEEAEAVHRRAKGLQESLVADFPLNPDLRRELAAGYFSTGTAMEAKGKRKEAEEFYRRAFAMQEKMLADFPDFPDVRGQMANTLFRLANLLGSSGRGAEAAPLYRRLLTLSPDSTQARNNLAWYLATCPDPKYRAAGRAVELATRTVAFAPQQGTFWNTLGVAQYRTGKWGDALIALTKSRELLKGRHDGYNGFFLAMSHWHLGEKELARKEFSRAVEWMEKHGPRNEELLLFRTEAAALLGIAERPKEKIAPR